MLKAKLQKLQVIVQKKCYNIHDREIIAIIYKKDLMNQWRKGK